MKVAFVTDSGCEHNQQEMKALGIYSFTAADQQWK